MATAETSLASGTTLADADDRDGALTVIDERTAYGQAAPEYDPDRETLTHPLVMMGGMGHLTISCDDCALRRSTACRDCMVSFILAADPTVDQVIDAAADPVIDTVHPGLDLDEDQERIVEMFAKAGLVPRLRHLAS